MQTNSNFLRDYISADRERVDALVRDAWVELADVFPGYATLAPRLGALTAKAADSEVMVVEAGGELLGAVGYLGPQHVKPDFFDPGWACVRMMSVSPRARGQGIGRQLLAACEARARRDNAPVLALHTSPLMESAQHLYRASGFSFAFKLPDLYGAPYHVLTKAL